MARTHYDNLNVTPTATDKEIRRAFKALAQKWHPDKNGHRTEEAEKNIKIINEAYRVLSSPELRQKHDTSIRRRAGETTAQQTRGSTYDDIDRRQSDFGKNTHRKKRKNSSDAANTYRVSKKRFVVGMMTVISIPTALAAIIFYANSFPGFIGKVPTVTLSKSPEASDIANDSENIERGLYDFFGETTKTLSFINDTDTAIAALARLEQSKSRVVNLAKQLDGADRTTNTKASRAVALGMSGFRSQIIRLQADSRIWVIVNPAISPMLEALRRIAG